MKLRGCSSQLQHLATRPAGQHPLDPTETPHGHESPPFKGEPELASDGVQEEERVTPCGVDFGPFDLREWVSEG